MCWVGFAVGIGLMGLVLFAFAVGVAWEAERKKKQP